MSIQLPPLNILYPFDRTGKSRDNFVSEETHTLNPVNNRIIVPKAGAFYGNSMIVRQGQKTLQKGVDYELAALYNDATVETGLPVHIMLYFSNLDITGDIALSYQVVGGQYTGTFEGIQKYVNALLVDPRSVRWEDVLNKPEFFVPADHFHDINDVYGLNELIPYLEEIATAITRMRTKELRNVYEKLVDTKGYVVQLTTQLSEKVDSSLLSINEQTGGLVQFNNRLSEIMDRISRIENGNQDKTLTKLIMTTRTELETYVQTFSEAFAQRNEVETNQARVMMEFSKYFGNNDHETGKLKDKYIRLDTVDKDNPLYFTRHGLNVKRPEPISEFSDVRPTDIYIEYNIDKINNNSRDVGQGTIDDPYITIDTALHFRKPGEVLRYHLKEGQNHLLEANVHCIVDGGVIEFVRWGNTPGVFQPAIHFANNATNNSRIPKAYIHKGRRINHCLYLLNATVIFTDIRISINAYAQDDLDDNAKSVIVSDGKYTHGENHVYINEGCFIDFGTKGYLWTASEYATNRFTLHESILRSRQWQGKNGRIWDKVGVNTITEIKTVADGVGKLYSPDNDTVKAGITVFFPNLVTSLINPVIPTNIAPEALKLNGTAKLNANLIPISDVEGNLLQVIDDKLYVTNISEANVYVDAVNGNNISGDGSRQRPYRTIDHAVVHVTDRKWVGKLTVYLKENQTHMVDMASGKTESIRLYADTVIFIPYTDTTKHWPRTSIHFRNASGGYYFNTAIDSTSHRLRLEFRYIDLKINQTSGGVGFVYALNRGNQDLDLMLITTRIHLQGKYAHLVRGREVIEDNPPSDMRISCYWANNVPTEQEKRNILVSDHATNTLFSGRGEGIKIMFDDIWKEVVKSKWHTTMSNIRTTPYGYRDDFWCNIEPEEIPARR